MFILRILFFAFGSFSGYYAVEHYYVIPVRRASQEEVVRLENENRQIEEQNRESESRTKEEKIKKEESKKEESKKESEEEQKYNLKKLILKANTNGEVYDPVINNVYVIFVSYAIYGLIIAESTTDGVGILNKANSDIMSLVGRITEIKIINILLCILVFVFFYTAPVKIVLYLFSVFAFKVRGFKFNFEDFIIDSYDPSFYFKKGWKGIIILLSSILFSIITWFCRYNQLLKRKTSGDGSSNNMQNIN